LLLLLLLLLLFLLLLVEPLRLFRRGPGARSTSSC